MSCCGIRCEAKIQQHSWTLAGATSISSPANATLWVFYKIPGIHVRIEVRPRVSCGGSRAEGARGAVIKENKQRVKLGRGV